MSYYKKYDFVTLWHDGSISVSKKNKEGVYVNISLSGEFRDKFFDGIDAIREDLKSMPKQPEEQSQKATEEKILNGDVKTIQDLLNSKVFIDASEELITLMLKAFK